MRRHKRADQQQQRNGHEISDVEVNLDQQWYASIHDRSADGIVCIP